MAAIWKAVNLFARLRYCIMHSPHKSVVNS